MCLVFVSAQAADLFDGKSSGGEQIFCMMCAALYHILHGTGVKELSVHMLKIRLTDGELVSHVRDAPVIIGHVVDLGADQRHPFIVSTDHLIRMCMQLFTEFDKEKFKIKLDGLFTVRAGGVPFVGDIFDK